MVVAVKILIALTILGFIIWPFVFKKENERELTSQEVALRDLLEQKEHTYAAIKELDFDYNMEKLSEGDYKELSKEYKQKAMTILQEIDKLSALVKAGNKARA